MSTEADRIWFAVHEHRERITAFLVFDKEDEDGWRHVQEEMPPAITIEEANRLHRMAVEFCRERGGKGDPYVVRSICSASVGVWLFEENARLRADVKRYEEREAHWAEVLRVADRGQYRADWDGRIRQVVARMEAAEDLIDRLADLEYSTAEDVEHILAMHGDQIPDYLRVCVSVHEKVLGQIRQYAKIGRLGP